MILVEDGVRLGDTVMLSMIRTYRLLSMRYELLQTSVVYPFLDFRFLVVCWIVCFVLGQGLVSSGSIAYSHSVVRVL